MADALRVNASVTLLDVRGNDISGDGASQLSAAVLGNTKIEVFNEIPVKEMRADSLTELDLKKKYIGVEGGMVVAGLVPVMASLTSVSLLRNDFDTEAAAMLLKVKEDHPKLKTLCGFSHEEKELNLHGFGKTKLGAADAMLIAPELGVMASITQVIPN